MGLHCVKPCVAWNNITYWFAQDCEHSSKHRLGFQGVGIHGVGKACGGGFSDLCTNLSNRLCRDGGRLFTCFRSAPPKIVLFFWLFYFGIIFYQQICSLTVRRSDTVYSAGRATACPDLHHPHVCKLRMASTVARKESESSFSCCLSQRNAGNNRQQTAVQFQFSPTLCIICFWVT